MFGRNTSCALGVSNVDEISENAPRHVTPQQLKAPKGTRFVHAACGRGHSLLVGSGGELWTCGANAFGQVRFNTIFSIFIIFLMFCKVRTSNHSLGNPTI